MKSRSCGSVRYLWYWAWLNYAYHAPLSQCGRNNTLLDKKMVYWAIFHWRLFHMIILVTSAYNLLVTIIARSLAWFLGWVGGVASASSFSRDALCGIEGCWTRVPLIGTYNLCVDKQRVLMHGHQGWNVRHSLCHIYTIYIYIYIYTYIYIYIYMHELLIAFVSFVVCSLL